jgi:cell division protein FtsL
MEESSVMGSRGTIRVAVAFATLLASLTLVVWRQGRALDALRELDATRSARAVAEAERAELTNRIQQLESRTRIVAIATGRLGMRIPVAGEEIVILLRGEQARSTDRVGRADRVPDGETE